MTTLMPGVQLASEVCATRIVVVRAGGPAALTCGGRPMVPLDEQPEATAPPDQVDLPDDLTGPTLIGKRYVDDAGELEVLCTRAGVGLLALDGTPLRVKGPAPLPSSD